MARGILSSLASAREELSNRREYRNRVRRASGWLRPGLYLVASDNGKVWRHRDSRLPDHLSRTVRIPERTARAFVASSLLRVVSPPTFLNRLSHAGPFSIAVAAREGGVVLLAPDRRQVGRLTTDGSHYSDRYIDLRRRLGRHLETPDFKVHDGGRMLVEELIAGSAFRDLPMHLQLSVTRKLIRSYASLVKNLGEDSAARLSGAVLDLVEQADLPASLRKHLLDAKLLERSMRWPLVPSHTDLFPNNIVIVRRSPVLIDLSRVEMMPFWYDPLSLVCSRYHGEYVRAGFLRGWLDGELEELCRAAGLAPTNLNRTRDALLVAYCVTRAYVRASMTDFDLAVFEYWARALWQGVETSRRRLQN